MPTTARSFQNLMPSIRTFRIKAQACASAGHGDPYPMVQRATPDPKDLPLERRFTTAGPCTADAWTAPSRGLLS